jgi:hypothetical protein
MIWLYRLRNLPMLVVLHFQHSTQYLRVGDAQRRLYKACEALDGCESDKSFMVEYLTHDLQEKLEKMADIDERMIKLWQRH